VLSRIGRGGVICLSLEHPLWLAFTQLACERRLSNKGLLEQIYTEALTVLTLASPPWFAAIWWPT
jgi:predicted DNA-binding ribbon-helix-helix protein